MATAESRTNSVALSTSLGALTRIRPTFRRYLTTAGPAFIASIAYMDPGNFAANVVSGSTCGYSLLWVLLAGNVFAIVVQSLACRLGIYTGKSLAENCRTHFPKAVWLPIWIISELMIIATDVAEVLGGAIGISLMFNTSLMLSALVVGILSFVPLHATRNKQRNIELVMMMAVATIGGAYLLEVSAAKPDWMNVTAGTLLPHLGKHNLLIAISMLGATVMPHVVHLHSGLFKDKNTQTESERKTLLRTAILDNLIALNLAWLINASMVITFANLRHDGQPVSSLEQAYHSLQPLFGDSAAIMFGAALVASGLSSTTVGIMAGQNILDGFIALRIPVHLRRLLILAPTFAVIGLGFDVTTTLVLSQVVLSFALPFTLIPLMVLSTSAKLFRKGNALSPLVKSLAFGGTVAIVLLNVWLVFNTIADLKL